MALSFEESKKQLRQQMATMSLRSTSPVTASAEPIAAYSGDGDDWTIADDYDWYGGEGGVGYSDDDISAIDEMKNVDLNPKQFNITQEHRSQFIPFKMLRFYDGYDLTNAVIYINYRRRDGVTRMAKAVNVKYNDTHIQFGWLVESHATEVGGSLAFEIVAIGTNYIWRSRLVDKMNVLDSIPLNSELTEVESDDIWLTEIATAITDKITNEMFEDQIDRVNQAKKEAIEEVRDTSEEARNDAAGYSAAAQQSANQAASSATSAASSAAAAAGYVDDAKNAAESVLENYSTTKDMMEYVSATLGNVGNKVGYQYRADYGKVRLNESDENETENVFTLYEIDGGSERVQSRFIIAGGTGSGSTSSIKIERVTPATLIIAAGDKAEIVFKCTSRDADDDIVNCSYALKKDSKDGQTIMSGSLEDGVETPLDVTKYVSTGETTFILTVTDAYGSVNNKSWTVKSVDLRLDYSLDDSKAYNLGDSVTFKYIPYGSIQKVIHFKLDGIELNSETTSISGGDYQPYKIDSPQESGSRLLEVWMTATFETSSGPKTISTPHIYKDIVWLGDDYKEPIIGCSYRNDYERVIEIRQYDTITIPYCIFDNTTSLHTIKRYVNDNTEPLYTDNTDESYNEWKFQTDEVGSHELKIAVSNNEYAKELIIKVKVEQLDIDVQPVTDDLVIDFNPTGITNSSAQREWSNGTYKMSVSDNFDWDNGGYKEDENEDAYFLVKAGTNVTFDYYMFSQDNDPSESGSEIKLIFMTENVQSKDAVWFTNAAKTETSVGDTQQITYTGIQLGVHEGWLKTNNASEVDIEGETSEDFVASTNTYLYMPYSENDIIEMDINIDPIDKNNNSAKSFVMAYEDGVPSKAYVYSNSDRFYHKSGQEQPITIGSTECDVRIYRMKIYSSSLTTENIMRNFISDARNTNIMLDRYNRNSIYYDQENKKYTPYSGRGVLDPEKLAPIMPNVKIMMLETDHFTTSKKTFVKSSLRCIHAPGGDMFVGDEFKDNWLFEKGWHSGQGTTSDNYGISSRNVDFLFNCDGTNKPSDKVGAESGYVSQVTLGYGTDRAEVSKVDNWKGNTGKVELTRTSVQNNFFNFKSNVASSENVNNMLLQKRYNDFLPYISPAKKRDANIKCTMEFVPAILFIRETNPDISTHTEFSDTNWHFYSLGNLGDSKKTDYTRAYDPEDMNEFTIEISDNTKNNATFQSGVYLDENKERQIEKFKKEEREVDGEIVLTPVSLNKPQSFVYPITPEEWESEENMRRWCLYNEDFDGDHSFEPRYACCGDYRDGKLVNDTSGRGEAQIQLNNDVWRAFYRWVVTSTDDEFRNELDQWCVREAVEFFYAFTHIYTMMDNRAKNTFWHFAKTGTYRRVSKPVPELLHIYCEQSVDGEYFTTSDKDIDDGKTYYTQYAFDIWDYDNDTAIGINNNGELSFPYGKEDCDYNIDGDTSSGYIFNGATSAFWCRLRDLLPGEIKKTVQEVSSECFNAENIINQFDSYQECYPEEIWRLDIQRKYIRIFTGKSIDNSKAKTDQKYLRDMMQGRKKYQRRQWIRDQMAYFGTKYLSDNMLGGTDNRITFRCYTPSSYVINSDYTLYITPYSDMYVTATFGNGDTRGERAKAGTRVQLDFRPSMADDTQVIIYCANRIQELNDLSNCYLTTMTVSAAEKLKELIIGSDDESYTNTRFDSLSLGNNKLLKKLNIRGCTKLDGDLDGLSDCNNLEELYADRTKITGATFATNGKINTIYLPDTIDNITMRKLNNLHPNNLHTTLNNLKALTLQGGNLDSFSIVDGCMDTLEELYLYDINWTNPFDATLLENIMCLEKSELTGEVSILSAGQYDIDRYKEKWPDLKITVGTLKKQCKVTFMNDDRTVLDVQYVYQYDSATQIADPKKDSDAQYDYEFAGWDKDLANITADTEIVATYTKTLRTYTVTYMSRGQQFYQKTDCPYGSIVFYDGDNVPTYTYEEPHGFYFFTGWEDPKDPDVLLTEGEVYVDGDKTINAKFEYLTYPDEYFRDRLLDELRPAELYMMMNLAKNKHISLKDYVGPKDQLAPIQLGHDFIFGNDTVTINDIDVDKVTKGEIPDYLKKKSDGSFGLTTTKPDQIPTDAFKPGIIKEQVVISEKTVFDGTNYIDTGINLLQCDRDFVLAIDYEVNPSSPLESVIAQCFSDFDTVGFQLKGSMGRTIVWGSKSLDLDTHQSPERRVLVLRYVKGENMLHLYSSDTHLDMPTHQSFQESRSMGHDSSLVFGCRKRDNGDYDRHASGVVYWSKIWYADLGEDVCTQLAWYPHESITFEACCETDGNMKQYYLSDGSLTCSSMTFIASSILSTQRNFIIDSESTIASWNNCLWNNFLNDRVYKAFPVEWKQLIKRVRIPYLQVEESEPEVKYSDCYVFIPSYAELFGGHLPNEAYGYEGSLISHLSTNEGRIWKGQDGQVSPYCTRTFIIQHPQSIYTVNTDGSSYNIPAVYYNARARIMISI